MHENWTWAIAQMSPLSLLIIFMENISFSSYDDGIDLYALTDDARHTHETWIRKLKLSFANWFFVDAIVATIENISNGI